MNSLTFLDIEVWAKKLTEIPAFIILRHQNSNTVCGDSAGDSRSRKTVLKANNLLFYRTQINTLQLYELFHASYCSCRTFTSQKRGLNQTHRIKKRWCASREAQIRCKFSCVPCDPLWARRSEVLSTTMKQSNFQVPLPMTGAAR